MPERNAEFVMSTELECLTATPGVEGESSGGISLFLKTLSGLAPSLPAGTGFFNAYGRCYSDCGHVELAMAECDCPFLLTSVIERQLLLARRAVETIRHSHNLHIVLTTNNHSGLLNSNASMWGAHENYLIHTPAGHLDARVLPFLVTRIYAGAGGIVYPSGQFVASVRALKMEHNTGGGTTSGRAIHSTSREEHLMGPQSKRFRYHLICGDGHRSHFNTALQFGATALALKAIEFDEQLERDIRRHPISKTGNWVARMQALNVLAEPGASLTIDPEIVDVQRLYLEAARRYARSLPSPPAWVPLILRYWDQTLDALAHCERRWLAARLDAFAKYEFFSSALARKHIGWQQMAGRAALFSEFALLDQSYHEFTDANSLFDRLVQRELIRHRVTGLVEPGDEADPFILDTTTRARARSRFIRDNHDHGEDEPMQMSWGLACNPNDQTCIELFDPFATAYSVPRPRQNVRTLRELLGSADRRALMEQAMQLMEDP